MLKSLSISILLFSFFCSFSQSKDSLLSVYNNQTIYRLGDYYIKGNERLRFSELQSEFNSNITKELYRRSKSSLTTCRILNYASFGLIIAGTALFANNKKGATELFAATLVLGMGGSHYRKQSTQFLDRAIWQRNKEVLFGER